MPASCLEWSRAVAYYHSPLLKIKRSPLTPRDTVTGSWAGALPPQGFAFSLKSCEKVSPGMTSPGHLPALFPLFFFPGKISRHLPKVEWPQAGWNLTPAIRSPPLSHRESRGRGLGCGGVGVKTGQDRAVPAIEWEVCLHNTCHSAKSLLLKIEKNKTKQKNPHEAMGQSVVSDGHCFARRALSGSPRSPDSQ